MIRFACPYCGKKLGASDTSVGKEKTCPNCRARVKVPPPETALAQAERKETKPREAADHPLLLMGRRPEHKDLIDMTAMVDIVFFLLIFFLVTSLQSVEAVIGLPAPQGHANSAETVQAAPDMTNDPSMVIVTIDADDAVFVDDEEAISEQDLRAKLRAAHKEQDKDSLTINTAADSTNGKFVMVLDAGADAGMKDILFTTPHGDTNAKP
ncbi:MAG TPA: biopolymer transporter ExbD [Lacipirellulaceae bacterium]|jgi:biopolymer transport protein ExbD|nr:biopolymer transporter ExbD [Lacipirellulaceae bacterium]